MTISVGSRGGVNCLFAILWLCKLPDRVRTNWLLRLDPEGSARLDAARYRADQHAVLYCVLSLALFGILYIDYQALKVFFPSKFEGQEKTWSEWMSRGYNAAWAVAGVGWLVPWWVSLVVWLVPPLILIFALLLLIAAVSPNTQVSSVLSDLHARMQEKGDCDVRGPAHVAARMLRWG